MKGRELPMLMDIKCSMVPSIKVNLTFDDVCTCFLHKDRIIEIHAIVKCFFPVKIILHEQQILIQY